MVMHFYFRAGWGYQFTRGSVRRIEAVLAEVFKSEQNLEFENFVVAADQLSVLRLSCVDDSQANTADESEGIVCFKVTKDCIRRRHRFQVASDQEVVERSGLSTAVSDPE